MAIIQKQTYNYNYTPEGFNQYTPEWAKGTDHSVPVTIFSSEQIALVENNLDEANRPPVEVIKSGAKANDGFDTISYPDLCEEFPERIYNGDNRSFLLFGPKGVVFAKGTNWLSEEHRKTHLNDGEVFKVGLQQIDIAMGKFDTSERMQGYVPPVIVPSVGSELEFQIVHVDAESGIVLPVDSQEFIKLLASRGLNVTIEGWASQMETPLTPIYNSSSEELTKGRYDNIRQLLDVTVLANIAGAQVFTGSVMIGDPLGQANFSNPHVRNVLMNTAGTNSVSEAAHILGDFRTNSSHTSVMNVNGEDGLFSEAHLVLVANCTHGAITPLMKAFMQSGNMYSLEALVADKQSWREHFREKLPTCRAGEYVKFSSVAKELVETGAAPSLERAAHISEGNIAGSPHDPTGRLRQFGTTENTVPDSMANYDKMFAFQTLLATYTGVINNAAITVLKNNMDSNSDDVRDDLLQKTSDFFTQNDLPVELLQIFVGNIDNQQLWRQLVDPIEQNGKDALVSYGGISAKASDILSAFINWVEYSATALGISILEEHKSDFEYLKDSLVGISRNWEEYFGLDGEKGGKGNAATTAQQLFHKLREETELTDNQIHAKIVSDYNTARLLHLHKLEREYLNRLNK